MVVVKKLRSSSQSVLRLATTQLVTTNGLEISFLCVQKGVVSFKLLAWVDGGLKLGLRPFLVKPSVGYCLNHVTVIISTMVVKASKL